MSLTEAQTLSLFEILETPYDGTVDEPMGEFHLTGLQHIPDSPERKLQTMINTRLASLSTAIEAKLKTYIERWDAIGTRVATISGGVGGISGVEYDPDIELARIQARVKVIIPVMKFHREITLDSERVGIMGFATR